MAKVPPGTKRIEVYLPEALAKRLEGLLHSDALGRVPYAAYNSFFVQRVNEFFNAPRAPMGDYSGFAPGDWIAGTPNALAQIGLALSGRRRAPEGLDEAFPELAGPMAHQPETGVE